MADASANLWEALKKLNNKSVLSRIFCEELGFDYVDTPVATRTWTDRARESVAEASILAAHDEFHVIHIRLNSDKLLLGMERPVVGQVLKEHPYNMVVFSNQAQDDWHFVNVKLAFERDADENKDVAKRRMFRRISVGPDEKLGNRLRTAVERLSLLKVPDKGIAPLELQARHDEAFNVEAVTERFFEDYKGIFAALQDDLRKQSKDERWAHDCALQFLNRVMFLYFVQRKRSQGKAWLGNDPEFMSSFWQAYRESGRPKDTFFKEWLEVLFFEAFNRKAHGGHKQFPSNMMAVLMTAPYLNGGLFTRNDLDTKYAFIVSDSRFGQVFGFLEQYNFTIAEDSPLDQEVAVDPEMIGKVYESLVNLSEEADERGEAGIFYTPRTEIDLMCRLSLVGYLANHLDKGRKPLLYEAVFAFEPDEKKCADRALASENLWPEVSRLIEGITVVDPACGSGSFLVGMLRVLDDLKDRANNVLGIEESPYERKKRIIGRSLYGVDVMQWAVDIAELRLWLQLVIDTELAPEELTLRPLLPNLSFKIRCGDSLVQQVGDVNLAHLKAHAEIPRGVKGKLATLKGEKLKFFNNDPACKYRNDKQIFQDEFVLFREILDARHKALDDRIKDIKKNLSAIGKNIFGDAVLALEGTAKKKMEDELPVLEAELARTDEARKALKTAKDVPFVWDIAFVEIFESDKGGFDIVIGNPPYVRQEKIADTLQRVADKKAYKAMLMRSVYEAFPAFFQYSLSSGAPSRPMDAKNDLYVYFYLHGLSLLNDNGAFCFITSNSWLDVGYGRDLQEFLLKNCHVRMVMDNQVKRTFKSADVNTIIALFSAPALSEDKALAATARFVMFKVPFEQALSPIVFEEIEEAAERKATPEYRVFPIRQDRLLEDGCEIPAEEEKPAGKKPRRKTSGPLIKVARYIGNKWGGKYLRAPDIYWTILEKGKGKLVRLGDIAEVRFGIKTGCNEFFYLPSKHFDIKKEAGCYRLIPKHDGLPDDLSIEEEFLKAVIKSPRECKRIVIDLEELKFKIFMCHKNKNDLKGTTALDYIKWGEKQAFHNIPSVSARRHWWDLGLRRIPPIISPSSVSELPRTFRNHKVLADKRLYEIYPNSNVESVLLATNCVTCSLFLELGSRTGLGEGLLDLTVYELADCLVAVPKEAPTVKRVLMEMTKRELLSLREEISDSNRRNLDAIVFDTIGLTRGEREAVYEAVIDLVEARLKKAGSLEAGGGRRRTADTEDDEDTDE